MKAKLNIGFLTGNAHRLNSYKCRWDKTVAEPHPDSATMYSTIFVLMEGIGFHVFITKVIVF